MICTYCCSPLNSDPVHKSIAHMQHRHEIQESSLSTLSSFWILTQNTCCVLFIYLFCFDSRVPFAIKIWKSPLLLILFWNEVQEEVNGSVLAKTQNPICNKEQYTEWCCAHFERKCFNNIIQQVWGGAWKRTHTSTKSIQRLWGGVNTSCHCRWTKHYTKYHPIKLCLLQFCEWNLSIHKPETANLGVMYISLKFDIFHESLGLKTKWSFIKMMAYIVLSRSKNHSGKIMHYMQCVSTVGLF